MFDFCCPCSSPMIVFPKFSVADQQPELICCVKLFHLDQGGQGVARRLKNLGQCQIICAWAGQSGLLIFCHM